MGTLSGVDYVQLNGIWLCGGLCALGLVLLFLFLLSRDRTPIRASPPDRPPNTTDHSQTQIRFKLSTGDVMVPPAPVVAAMPIGAEGWTDAWAFTRVVDQFGDDVLVAGNHGVRTHGTANEDVRVRRTAAGVVVLSWPAGVHLDVSVTSSGLALPVENATIVPYVQAPTVTPPTAEPPPETCPALSTELLPDTPELEVQPLPDQTAVKEAHRTYTRLHQIPVNGAGYLSLGAAFRCRGGLWLSKACFPEPDLGPTLLVMRGPSIAYVRADAAAHLDGVREGSAGELHNAVPLVVLDGE